MKKYIALWLACIFVFMTAVPAGASEAESGWSDWAALSIERALRMEMLDANQSYDYQKEITRAEFSNLVFRLVSLSLRFGDWFIENVGEGAEALPETMVNPFADTQDVWVILLHHFGIINGKTETEFVSDAPLTREEAAAILIRAIDKTAAIEATELWYAYEDNAQVSEWAMPAVQRISNYGFMQGVGDNRFAPQDTCTMEQAVVVVMRVFDVCFPIWMEEVLLREMGELGYVYENDTWNYVTYDMATGRRVKPITVDAETFEILENTEFARDKDSVYHMASKVEGADPETFETIKESTGILYAKDKKRVYVYTQNSAVLVPVIGADPETFEVLECPYAKDKRDAYNGCLPLYVDNVETFEVLDGNGGINITPLETFLHPGFYSEETVLYNIEKYGFLKSGPVLYSNGGRAKTDRQYFEGYRLIEED